MTAPGEAEFDALRARLAEAERVLREAERFVTHYMSMPLGTRIADRKRLLASLRARLAPEVPHG